MKLSVYLVLSLWLTSCGYHLIGHGEVTAIPDGVSSASLLVGQPSTESKGLRSALKILWLQQASLPELQDTRVSDEHITLRIEQAAVSFVPIAFDASGLAIQYRLQVRAVLNMYQSDALIWGAGSIMVAGDVFGDSSPSAIEAEREQLLDNLRQQWAKEAMRRLQSGF